MKKQKKLCVLVFVVTVVITAVCIGTLYAQSNMQDIAAKIKRTYPQFQVGEIRNTPIDGLYEVEAGTNIIYYYQKNDMVIFGEIWNKNGQSLTQERRNEMNAKMIKELPLDKALKIGNGSKKIVEFTDPDCPYCRKAAEYFKDRNDVTRYVFLVSLRNNQAADSKIANILCSNDKVKAFKEAMSGGMDNKPLETCKDDNVMKVLNEYKELFIKSGVRGTPAFWIDTKFVSGANIPLIESIIGKKIN